MRGVRQLTEGTREKSVDEFGVRQVELYHNDAGKAYCLLEGPDAESIRSITPPWGSPAATCTRCRRCSDSGPALTRGPTT